MTWPILRTVCFDELVLHRVAQGIDIVLNLAAGLDARPYRLQLPASLHWIEVDLPEVIAYKEEKLAGVATACHLRRVAVHLSQPDLRQALFAQVNAASARVLVLTEGLLTYLRAEEVTSLAFDLYKLISICILDYRLGCPFTLTHEEASGQVCAPANANVFCSSEVRNSFARSVGVAEFRDFLDEGRRLNREIPMADRAGD